MKKRHPGEDGGGNSTADRDVEYTTDAVPRQQKRTLKPLISARSIRACLFSRKEFLALRPGKDNAVILAISTLLNFVVSEVSA